jgi:hypothetical protein
LGIKPLLVKVAIISTHLRRLIMEHSDSNLDGLYQDLARRFRVLSQFFGKLGSEEAVQQLLDSLISRDAIAFNRLIETVDIPDIPPGLKCRVIHQDLIEKVLYIPYTVEVCRLRPDLTPDERRQYLGIAFRYLPTVQSTMSHIEMRLTLFGEAPEIPPGSFLDELKANNLVTCNSEVKYDLTLVGGLGPPEEICT